MSLTGHGGRALAAGGPQRADREVQSPGIPPTWAAIAATSFACPTPIPHRAGSAALRALLRPAFPEPLPFLPASLPSPLPLQKYDLVPIDANTLQSMHKDGTLNWGKLPALQDGAAIIEDRFVEGWKRGE